MTLQLDKPYGPVSQPELLAPRTTLADAARALRDQRWQRYKLGAPLSLAERYGPVSADVSALIHEQAVDQARDAKLSVQVHDLALALEAALPALETRRRIAHSVATRLKGLAPKAGKGQARDLAELPEKMFLCRVEGDAGQTDAGDTEFAWAHKCESSKFCPDCARSHSMYEAARYTSRLVEHVSRGRDYRAHFAVFTRPSVPLGKMAEGVAETLEMFREWLQLTVPCTDEQRDKYGWGKRKRKLPLWQLGQRKPGLSYDGRDDEGAIRAPGGFGLHGALVQLECHLTAKGMWHPHLNVILLTRGEFSYAVARDAWGFNVELQEIQPKAAESLAEGFVRAFRELIKYPFRHVAEKNLDKREAGDTDAPPFEAWPDEAILEWHAATRRELDEEAANGAQVHGTRWLRSYGALHGVKAPEPELREVRWLARLTFNDDGRFFVDSILGSKFRSSHEKPMSPGYRVPQIRPPPRPPGAGP